VELATEGPSFTLWETQLRAELDYPGVTGQAAAVSGPGGTEAGVDLRGAEPGAAHAWGVRVGSCASPGQQIGPDSDYPVLEVGETGSASVNTQLAVQLSLESAYHVEVRVSASDATRVACGDLAEAAP
jgi:hypothetical protein